MISGGKIGKTEMRNPDTMHIDRCQTDEVLRIIQRENEKAVKAVEAAIPQIAAACDAIARSMKNGGRLIYVGAGTSGRLGVLDAAECPPTFGVDPGLVTGIIAGGYECMVRASENAEDSGENGIADLKKISLRKEDSVVGISASGNARYVADALSYAKSIGCVTAGITSNYGSRLDLEPDFSIVSDTGPEPITGSTRMKAGTAQKIICNMISTTVMIKLGMVYENMMINLRPTNEKLRRRCVLIVSEILSCGEAEAEKRLSENGWSIRAAVESRDGLAATESADFR
ncbi:MAG: N-acetylmuramic acid 6-phosphate etherase [Clostridia bacterium]|nr:N-acetylmuramic acid 6-phosphate etherase [Clostridia bacterium]